MLPDDAKRERILIVDDESYIVTELGDYLERKGAQVFYADSGESALALFENQRETPLTHMIVDLRMPPPDGFEVIGAIDPEKFPELKIIAVSGHASAEDEARALSLGAASFLAKPYDLADLMKLIRPEPSASPE